MKNIQILKNSFSAVNNSKRYLFIVYGLNFLLAIILASSLALTIETSIGKSAVGDNLLEGYDDFWFSNFLTLAKGLSASFEPSVSGMGAIFNSLETALSGSLFDASPLIIGMGSIYLLLWVFFNGGFISIYINKNKEVSFFQSAANFFPRILMLSILSWIMYIILFKYLFSFLTWGVDELNRENINERVHFFYTLIKYLILWILVLTVNIIFDYGKILIILRDSKRISTTLLSSITIIFSSFLKTYGLYFLIGLLLIIFMIIYWVIVPGAGQSSWLTIFATFLLGQLYIFSRIWIRCLFIASQSDLCKYLEEKII